MDSGERVKSFSHLNTFGEAKMVDVSSKNITLRTAKAHAVVRMDLDTANQIEAMTLKKGDVLAVARIAAIQAAKKTDDLIPLCHSLPLSSVAVEFSLVKGDDQATLAITSLCITSAQTGVEMEALTAVSVAALTIYDMCKAIDKLMVIGDIRLLLKTGGRSGDIIHQDM